MIILLSPAKTQDFESSSNTKKFSFPVFSKEAMMLAEAIKQLSITDLAMLMNISPKIAELNYKRFRNYSPDFNEKNAKQALLAYKGDVYKAIDADNYSEDDFDFAQKHLRIFSGFYGLLKPLDLIQPYRLEMDLNLKTDNAENVYEFWDNKITSQINAELKEFGYKYVVNLASNEYFNSLNPDMIDGKLIKITFWELKDDGYKVIGILSKRARGMMADYIIKNRIENPPNLKNFDLSGYQYNQEFSQDNEFIFTRLKI